jgi:hypothetical protein
MACYAAIVLASFFLIWAAVKTPIFTEYDAGLYLLISNTISRDGLGAIEINLRTYGYPLFIALARQLHDLLNLSVDLLNFVVLLQFIFHTVTSFLTMLILRQQAAPRKIPFALGLACFALVQFNPLLLGLTHDILTETLATATITVFFWAMFATTPVKYVLIGTSLAISIVVRPYFESFALAFGGLLLGLVVLRFVTTYRLYDVAKIPRVRALLGQWITKRRFVSVGAKLLQVLVPIVLIVGPQYMLVYNAEGHFALAGRRFTTDAARILTTLGVYVYKYETYTGPEPLSRQVFYYDGDHKVIAERMVAAEGGVNLLSYAAGYPLAAAQTVLIKTVGAFQSYEWSTYRLSVENSPNYVFVFGLLIFSLFVFLNMSTFLSIVRGMRQPLPESESIPFQIVVLWAAVNLIVFSYSFLSPVETRFIVPAFPILTATALYMIWRTGDRRTIIIALIVATTLYLVTYQVLQVSRI